MFEDARMLAEHHMTMQLAMQEVCVAGSGTYHFNGKELNPKYATACSCTRQVSEQTVIVIAVKAAPDMSVQFPNNFLLERREESFFYSISSLKGTSTVTEPKYLC